jgi:hypothetical protein
MNSKRFRVWLYNDDYRSGRYFTPEDNYIDKAQTTSLVLNLAGDVVCAIHKKEPYTAVLIWARVGNSGITVNQSTLVHDSQGVEIFEDDVVIHEGIKYFVLDPDTLRTLDQKTLLPIPRGIDLTVVGKISPMGKLFYEEDEVAPPDDFYFLEDYETI